MGEVVWLNYAHDLAGDSTFYLEVTSLEATRHMQPRRQYAADPSGHEPDRAPGSAVPRPACLPNRAPPNSCQI